MTPLKPRRQKKRPQEFSRLLKAKFQEDLEASVVQQRYNAWCDKYLRKFLALFSLNHVFKELSKQDQNDTLSENWYFAKLWESNQRYYFIFEVRFSYWQYCINSKTRLPTVQPEITSYLMNQGNYNLVQINVRGQFNFDSINTDVYEIMNKTLQKKLCLSVLPEEGLEYKYTSLYLHINFLKDQWRFTKNHRTVIFFGIDFVLWVENRRLQLVLIEFWA